MVTRRGRKSKRRWHRSSGGQRLRPAAYGVVSVPLPATHPVRETHDAVLALTVYHPDYAFLESMGIRIDGDTWKPVVDPDNSETNVPGIYLAGGIIAGRVTNRIFIENGRFHGKKIVSHLSGT